MKKKRGKPSARVHSSRRPRIRTVVAGIIERDARLLICQRRADDAFPLKWEFPGGKVRPGESPADALRRELREELGIEPRVVAEIARYRHRYPAGPAFELVFFAVRKFTGKPRNLVFEAVRWVAREALPRYDFLAGDRALVERLARGQGFRSPK